MQDTVLITGANRGLGLALAEEFDLAGFGLVLHSRANLPDAPSVFRKAKGVICGDLTNLATLLRLAESEANMLVNNAGIYLSKPFAECSGLDIESVLRTNLIVPMMLTSMLWRKLKMVVNISSLAARGGGPGEAVYAASKAGLVGFSETLQFDGTKSGVRVLGINLGALRTDMTKGRPNWDMLTDPGEAAQAIVGLCKGYCSLRVTSVDIKRSLY